MNTWPQITRIQRIAGLTLIARITSDCGHVVLRYATDAYVSLGKRHWCEACWYSWEQQVLRAEDHTDYALLHLACGDTIVFVYRVGLGTNLLPALVGAWTTCPVCREKKAA